MSETPATGRADLSRLSQAPVQDGPDRDAKIRSASLQNARARSESHFAHSSMTATRHAWFASTPRRTASPLPLRVSGLLYRCAFNPERPRVDGACMVRALLPLLFLAIALAPGSSGAEVYRCDEADGSVRFVDSLHACPNGRIHEPEGRVQRLTASERPRTGESGRTPPARIAPIAVSGIASEDVLLPRPDVSAEWDVVDEMPEDAARDPDLVAWGVREKRARHYTRVSGDAVQVCSIEVWIFRDADRARRAQQEFAYPDWHFAREAAVLIAVHGLTRPRGGTPTRGVFSACGELEARTRARAEAALRR